MDANTYAGFDQNGYLVAFWRATEEAQTPPDGFIVLTDEQATTLMNDPSGFRLVDGSLVPVDRTRVNKIYAGFNVDGFPSGFWQSLAYPDGSTPPDGYVELSEDQFNDLYTNQGRRRLVDGEIVAYDPPAPEPGPYQIAKTTPWLRMTDGEGDLVYAAMSETSSRLRAIYDAATFLSSGDPLWSTMHDILAATLSPARADELLAPET